MQTCWRIIAPTYKEPASTLLIRIAAALDRASV
jgi:hypothetical protein